MMRNLLFAMSGLAEMLASVPITRTTRTGPGRASIFSDAEHRRRYGGKKYDPSKGRVPGRIRRARERDAQAQRVA